MSLAARLCLYYRPLPEQDRWLPGDKYVRPLIRRIVRGKPRMGGVDKVFHNLRLGLDRLRVPYLVNLPFQQLGSGDVVGVLGRGRRCLEGYDRPNPIVAGIGLMAHPSEWPTLCEEYPVVRYLQHSHWANEVYVPYFGEDRCRIWPVGIDSDHWRPNDRVEKTIDVLLYNKVLFDRMEREADLVQPVREALARAGVTVMELTYGSYTPEQFKEALLRSRAMVFLCEHESQGLAYQECLSSNVPILAWDQGWYLAPERFEWGIPRIPATSVPYWDERCGMTFVGAEDFDSAIGRFWEGVRAGSFAPRDYILENLTLEKCAHQFVAITGSL